MKISKLSLPGKLKKFKWLLVVFTAVLLFGMIGYFTIIFGGRFVVDEEDFVLPARTVIETTDGTVIKTLYEENREPVSIDSIPVHVQNAFLAIEDNRFYEHAGIDFKSIMRAVYKDIVAMRKAEGGSTITQQLAKNLFLHNEKTWMRKTKEVMAATYLERNMSKEKILEYYLNEIYFAHGKYGLGAAAQFYFSKPVQELTVSEGALLAALSKAPNTYSPIDHPKRAKERRDLVLQQMDKLAMIDTNQRMEFQGKTLGLNVEKKAEQPWMNTYVDLVMKEAQDKYNISFDQLKRGGYRIAVSVNETAQEIAYRQFKEEEFFHGSAAGIQGAFVLIDQQSGEIAAAIGGREYELGNLNRTLVKRQPGSVIKPLAVYGPAMMLDEYKPYSLLTDQRISYNAYTAENIDDVYQGTVTMYDALKDSKNAPAVWLLDQIGIPYAKNYLEKLDINIDDDGLAIALGGLTEGVSPIQIAQAYRSFIHEGEQIEPYTISKIYDRNGKVIGEANPEPTIVFSPQTAWNMVRMLEGVITDGTGKHGHYTGPLAGKTGSTEHPHVSGQVKDAWFAGLTPEYATALWMGYDTSDKAHYLTEGSKAPTELTKSILTELSKHQEMAGQFEVPEHVKDLPAPIRLPVINDLTASYKLGGFTLVKGKLNWTPDSDSRIIYHVYLVTANGAKKIGETTEGRFTVDRINLFKENSFYVIPYNTLTKQEGLPSNQVQLMFGF